MIINITLRPFLIIHFVTALGLTKNYPLLTSTCRGIPNKAYPAKSLVNSSASSLFNQIVIQDWSSLDEMIAYLIERLL